MPRPKQFSDRRLQPLRPAPSTAARPLLPPSHEPDQPPFGNPPPRDSWRVAASRVSGTVAHLVTQLSIEAAVAFPNVVLAVLSWVISEFLAGCAAYGQALYCVPTALEDRSDVRDPEPRPPSAGRHAMQPYLVLISGHATGPEHRGDVAAGGRREGTERCDRGLQH